MAMKKFLLVIFFMVLATLPAMSVSFHMGEKVIIPKYKVLNDNLYAIGQTVYINGHIRGDVYALAETIIVRGKIDGDLNVIGKIINIKTPHLGDLRAIAEKIFIRSHIKNDVLTLGQNIVLSKYSTVGKDALMMGETLHIDGVIGRRLFAKGKQIIQGKSLKVKGKKIIKLHGTFESHFAPQRFKEKMIQVAFTTILAFKIYQIFMLWGFLWLSLKIYPNLFGKIQKAMNQRFFGSVGISILFFILLPLIFIFLALSLIGLPLIPIILLSVLLIIFVYKMFLAVWLGEHLLRPFNKSKRKKKKSATPYHLQYWVGMIALLAISFIPIVSAIFFIFGFFWVLGVIVAQKKELLSSLQRRSII